MVLMTVKRKAIAVTYELFTFKGALVALSRRGIKGMVLALDYGSGCRAKEGGRVKVGSIRGS
jgi:hypothetical protein